MGADLDGRFYRGFNLLPRRDTGGGLVWQLYALPKEAMAAAGWTVWVDRKSGRWVRVAGGVLLIELMLDGVLHHGGRSLGDGRRPGKGWRFVFWPHGE